MNKYIGFFLISLLIASAGCDPYRFAIKSYNPIDARIFSDHHLVRSIPGGFTMEGGSVVGIQELNSTEYYFETYLTHVGSGGFQLFLRPVVEERVVDSGYILTFSSTGMRLDSAGKLLQEKSTFRFPDSERVFVTIYNEEKFLQVTVGCDTVIKLLGSKIASDDIVFKTLPDSKLTIQKAEWYAIKFHEGDDITLDGDEKRR